jgi:hypothetical protein
MNGHNEEAMALHRIATGRTRVAQPRRALSGSQLLKALEGTLVAKLETVVSAG